MVAHLDVFGAFVFFGVFSFLGGLYILFLVPETKGLTLEEMDLVFSDETHGSTVEHERLAAIHKRIGLDAYAHGVAPPSPYERSSTEKEKGDVEHHA